MIEENKNYYNNVAPIFRSQSDKSYKGNYLAYSSNRVNKGATEDLIKAFNLDNNFKVLNSRANGDCFFESMSQALMIHGITNISTINELRSEVSKFGTIDYLKSLQEIYKSERRYHRSVHLNEYLANVNLENISFNSRIESEFKKWMNTQNYWADEFAINALEQKYSIKILPFSTETNSFSCFGNDNGSNTISPNLYFMLNHQGAHYELITFNGKAAFTYDDLPNKVKNIIVQTCINKNSIYNKIDGFKEILSRNKNLTNKEISWVNVKKYFEYDVDLNDPGKKNLNEIDKKKDDEKIAEVIEQTKKDDEKLTEVIELTKNDEVSFKIRSEDNFNLGYDLLNEKINIYQYFENVIKFLIKTEKCNKIVVGGSNLDERFQDYDVVTGHNELHRQISKETYNENISNKQYANYFLNKPIQLNFDFNENKQVTQLFNNNNLKFSQIALSQSTIKFLKRNNIIKFIQYLFGSLCIGGKLFFPIINCQYQLISIDKNNKIKYGKRELLKGTDFILNNSNFTYTLSENGYKKLKYNSLIEILMPTYAIEKDNQIITPDFSLWKNNAMREILQMYEGSYRIINERYPFKSIHGEDILVEDYFVIVRTE